MSRSRDKQESREREEREHKSKVYDYYSTKGNGGEEKSSEEQANMEQSECVDGKRKAATERVEEKEMVSLSVLQLSWFGSCLIRRPYGTLVIQN